MGRRGQCQAEGGQRGSLASLQVPAACSSLRASQVNGKTHENKTSREKQQHSQHVGDVDGTRRSLVEELVKWDRVRIRCTLRSLPIQPMILSCASPVPGGAPRAPAAHTERERCFEKLLLLELVTAPCTSDRLIPCNSAPCSLHSPSNPSWVSSPGCWGGEEQEPLPALTCEQSWAPSPPLPSQEPLPHRTRQLLHLQELG